MDDRVLFSHALPSTWKQLPQHSLEWRQLLRSLEVGRMPCQRHIPLNLGFLLPLGNREFPKEIPQRAVPELLSAQTDASSVAEEGVPVLFARRRRTF